MRYFTSLNFLKYLFLSIAMGLIVLGSFNYYKGYGLASSYKDKFTKVFKAGDSPCYLEEYKAIFSHKLDYYQKSLSDFGGIQKWMLAILITSMLVLVYGVDNIPLFGFTIPDSLIYLIIFFGGIYFWVNFGLTFNTLIDDRLSLLSYMNKIESYGVAGPFEYMNNPRFILIDNSLLDNWFSHYFKFFTEPTWHRRLFEALGLYFIYALLLGIYISSIMISIIEFGRRKTISIFLRLGLVLFSITMFAVSTTAFLFGEKAYSVLWMGTIWFFAALGLFYWSKYGKDIYEKNRKNILVNKSV